MDSEFTRAFEEYLTIAETAARLGVSPKRIRNLMSARVFKRGDHFVRPDGMGPRFKWSRVIAWLEGGEDDKSIPMARQQRVAGGRNGGV